VPVSPATLVARFAPAGLAAAGVGLAFAIAVGAVHVPDLAGAISDATHALGAWIYVAVLVLVFLETTVLVGFVIHGELALLVGGVAAERGDAALPVVLALAWGAAVAGDVTSLLLGRRLGRPFLERHGPRVGLGPDRLSRVDEFFARHGSKAVFLGRFTGLLRATMPFAAGSSGMRPRQILRLSALSALVWVTTFTLIGYAFAESFAAAGETATRVALVAVLLVIAALIVRARLRPRVP
jgi:membrane protein DedA with SNARE-associated domain